MEMTSEGIIMANDIRYVHTNIVAKDWKALTQFYCEVFGCHVVGPKRDLSGEWIDALTGIKNARLQGAHLSLPGYEGGPTLEIFEYDPSNLRESLPEISRQGFGHIAFHVENVEAVLWKVLEQGGSQIGRTVQKQYPELGLLTAVYARDPEGNFIEMQNWKK
jgi:catechol 2,3-dioxygenase-like lactoylglutathione lyase family enzyme